jgi:hypothetical protein
MRRRRRHGSRVHRKVVTHLAEYIRLLAARAACGKMLVHCGGFRIRQLVIEPSD